MIYGEPNTSWDKGKQSQGFKPQDEYSSIPVDE